MKHTLLAIVLALWPALASAGLTDQQIGSVSLQPPPDARVPMSQLFKDLGANSVSIGQAIGNRPTLLMPADFTCKQICGPALSIAATALKQTGLVAGRDYSVVVVGIDPRDGIEDARRFANGQIDGPGISVLSGTSEAIGALLGAVGYQTEVDVDHDAIAHPAAFMTLSPDGHVVRALSSLALQPTDLRLALIEAGAGRIGGITGRIALLCYGFDAVHGIYTTRITAVLRIAGAMTVVVLAGAIGLMLLHRRRSGASA